MHRDSDRHKLFNRRTLLLAGGKFALMSALAGRLYYLQVVESEKYATLADENRINFRLLPPPRGRITDRNGVPLADSQQNYRVLLVPENARDLEATLDALDRIVPLTEVERRRILRDVARNRSFVPVTVRENLDWREVARIEVNTPDLPGIVIDVGQSRYYPYGREAAHVLGYVAPVSEKDQADDPLLQLPGFRIGKAGIERVHDLKLRGTGGSSQLEVNAYGRVIRELSRQEGEPGAEVQLTIDLALQRYTSERLAGESASAVVLDVHSGEVLALASQPSFDPNSFNHGLKADEWRDLTTNPRAPLIDKAIAGQYAPGSTFKMIVAHAALERGIITPSTEYYCPGYMTLGNARFHCWKKWGHGRLNCAQAITQSCDVFFYEVAKRVGVERIAEMARRFGLGDELGLDLPGERSGLVPTPEWKKKAVGASWQKGETVILGIGQGYILVTPLQLAVMTARLVNGGRAVTPRVTRSIIPQDGSRQPVEAPPSMEIEVSQKNLALIREAMISVVNEPRGTAYRSRIEEPGMAMGGKTGTVQVRRITKAERDQGLPKADEIPWEERDHALFVGFAPTESPRYAVSVVVEHGGGGSSTAAPIARDILMRTQELAPSGGPGSAISDARPRRGAPPGEA